jgi:nicotinate phosphoribosyltransferase
MSYVYDLNQNFYQEQERPKKAVPIWTNFLDQDAYKFSMAQAVFHNFPGAEAEYQFICRGPETELGFLKNALLDEIRTWDKVSKPIAPLKNIKWISNDFLDFIDNFKLRPQNYVKISDDQGFLDITIRGPWINTIWYEVPVLATVSELYFNSRGDLSCGYDNLNDKISSLLTSPIRLVDMGTRRRRSCSWHREVVKTLAGSLPRSTFIGTSNVLLAHENNIPAIGTMAHEWISAGQALFHPLDSQKRMLEIWQQEYNGQLGIALSDTLGTNKFVKDFSGSLAKAFDGVRQDSGDEIEWLNRMLKMYSDCGIDPKTKTAIFSNALTVKKAQAIETIVNNSIKTTYGIGTHLTNDIPDVKPLNIVMKLVKLNGRPVAKLSVDPSKAVCKDKLYLAWLKESINHDCI